MTLARVAVVVGSVAVGLMVQGCTTKPVVYGPMGPEAPWGYADRPNPDASHTVTVVMPGHAAPGQLREFFERRAGELCPGGIERTNVFRMDRTDSNGAAPYVYGSAGIGQRIALGTRLEGYVYCKPPTAPAAAS